MPALNVGPDVWTGTAVSVFDRIEVEQLATVPRPGGARPAGRRDLPAAAVHLRERPHVDLDAPGLVRLVGEVAAVGRELRPASVEQGLESGTTRDGLARATGLAPVGSRGSPGETAGPVAALDTFEADESVPSGVMDIGYCGFGARRQPVEVPVPSAAWLYRFSTPARSDVKMIRRPSGVQSGIPSQPGSKVKRLSVSPREIPDPDVGVP